ncbi:MAG: glycosyltransferase [Candidatus Rickettsiella isopodorum]|nr:glycosyltransferase [Candidatus Rickettsiella isopodorum]MDD5342148.1 glycosyltransferase [Patescibacteria group bacterium]
MTEPIVSVCLITYNHVNYIRDAIEGVLMQKINYPWELIIADDFSTDGTREIIKAYAEKNPKLIKLILQEKNVGAAQNWFDLIYTPKSKYITYFEGDDYWTDPYKLQKQIDLMEKHNDYSACCHAVQRVFYIDKKPLGVYRQANRDRVFSENEWYKLTSMQSSLLLRNKYIAILPDWITYSPVGDVSIRLFVSQQGKFAYINQIMSSYRVGVPNSSTKTIMIVPKNDFESAKRMVKMYDGFNNYTNYKYSGIITIKQLYYLMKELKINKNIGRLDFLKRHKERIKKLSFGKKLAFLGALFLPKIYNGIYHSRKLQPIRNFLLR